MAENKKKSITPSVGFYNEPGFVSLTTSLRKISGDDTLPTDNYVDIYKNLYDLITPDNDEFKGGVIDISLTKDKKELVIFYDNNTNKKLPLEDNFLFQIYYDNISKLIYFILTNGQKITLDLGFLKEQYATKDEVIEIQNDIIEINEEIENINVNVENINKNITNIENMLDDGIDSIKWKNF